MSMSEEEARRRCNVIIKNNKFKLCNKIDDKDCTAIETLIEASEKKDKIIKLMAEEIDDCGECPHEIYEEDFDCTYCEKYSSIDCWQAFFERKVEEKNV